MIEERYKLIHSDAANMPLADESIDLTVTSPPYDNLRTYNGFTFDFESIAKELYRVTKKGGVVVWVVGDATIKGSETGTSFRQALYFKEIGFNLHDTMIYQKTGTGACGSNYTYWQSFEYMFVLSKGKPVIVNRLLQPNKSIGKSVTKSVKSADLKTRHETFNKRIVSAEGVRPNIWQFCGNKYSMGGTSHPAPFPEKLAQDHILSWSNEGDTVLDCFCGSGTTGKMALLNNRKFIGIDISFEYLKNIAKQRIESALTKEPLFQ